MNSRRRTIRTSFHSSGSIRAVLRARSFLHDRSRSGGCSSLRLLYTLLRVSSKNRDLLSSGGYGLLSVFICVCLALEVERKREKRTWICRY